MKKFFKDAVGHVMTGIGYMLPLIVGASLVVAIPKIIALCMGITSLDPYAETEGFTHILYLIEQVGWTGIGLTNTVLAGFIAYSIADKPAIGAGLIGGMVASNTNAGFLGALIAAFAAGYTVKWAKEHIHLPEAMQQIMPLVICPFLATGAVALLMGVILAGPLSFINASLVEWLRQLCTSGTSQLVLALILGAMICSDMGGPINKSAWMAGNVLMTEGIFQPNVFINCAICIPPLAYAIATTIRKKRFSADLYEGGNHGLHWHYGRRNSLYTGQAPGSDSGEHDWRGSGCCGDLSAGGHSGDPSCGRHLWIHFHCQWLGLSGGYPGGGAVHCLCFHLAGELQRQCGRRQSGYQSG